jgi:hypothetical protein
MRFAVATQDDLIAGQRAGRRDPWQRTGQIERVAETHPVQRHIGDA